MGFSKEGRTRRALRGVKTLFFLITMLISLLLFSAPVLLVIADALLPSTLLSASLSPCSLSLQTLSSHLSNYDFRSSLIDIPLISLIRSAVILCVYSFCDGPSLSRGPYLGVATVFSVSSLVFVSLKASYVFMSESSIDRGGYARAMEVALFVCSLVLAVGHVVVAYRTSCRERRKLLVYKIDIEALNPIYSSWTNWWDLADVEAIQQLVTDNRDCVRMQERVSEVPKNTPGRKSKVKKKAEDNSNMGFQFLGLISVPESQVSGLSKGDL